MKPPAGPQQISLLPPDAAALLHLVRENLRLLAEFTSRDEVGRIDPPAGGPGERVFGSPAAVAAYLGAELADLDQEQMRALLLNTKHRLVGAVLVCQGGLNAAHVRTADCFREAVRAGAASIILVHNHPSGDPTPSAEDVRFTADVAAAGDLLEIEVLDHVVVGQAGAYVSLRERGLYRPDQPQPPDAPPAARRKRAVGEPTPESHGASGVGARRTGLSPPFKRRARHLPPPL